MQEGHDDDQDWLRETNSRGRNAPVTLDRDTMLDLLELVVELEHAQRAT